METLKVRDKLNYDIKNTEDTKLVNDKMLNSKKKRKSTRRGPKKRITNLDHIKPEDDSNNNLSKKNQNKNIKKNNLVINSKILNTENDQEKIRNSKDLDMYELNELNYADACELDNRGFCKTYWSVLMREHLVLFTFFS